MEVSALSVPGEPAVVAGVVAVVVVVVPPMSSEIGASWSPEIRTPAAGAAFSGAAGVVQDGSGDAATPMTECPACRGPLDVLCEPCGFQTARCRGGSAAVLFCLSFAPTSVWLLLLRNAEVGC